jgi:hypothetical protein
MDFIISRFEEIDGNLFIAIKHKTKPLIVEHFFTEEEKLDINDTITKLVAQLEVMEEEYQEKLVVSKINELSSIRIDERKKERYKEEYKDKKNKKQEDNQTSDIQ